jgi:DNA-binding transcriptional LysR family regulator
MERLARIATMWSYLPAFRAVAETENVHEAARQLGVSPSSLSRAIGLLEARLGRPLFERAGRTLALTPLGRELLATVRAAMRAVDDLAEVHPETLRIAAPADLAVALVVPALTAIGITGASRARVTHDPEVDPVGRLLRGELDLALTCDPPRARPRELELEVVGEEQRLALYVGAEQPVGDGAAEWPQAVYVAPGGVAARWPSERPRTIALEVADPRDAAAAAIRGPIAVALPERLVAALDLPLRRLPGPPVAEAAALCLRRRSLGRPHRADVLVAALRAGPAKLLCYRKGA